MAALRQSLAHGHETNELEAFINMFEHRDMEDITYLCHVTDDENFRKSLMTGSIEGSNVTDPFWSPLARDDAPKGVMFEASLFHSELPEKSSFGDTRIKIPCQFLLHTMVHPRLFLETFYYYRSAPKQQYIRLILLDGYKHDAAYHWCMERCMRRVNPLDNDMLILDREKRSYKVSKNDGILFPYVWVQVFVVGSVETVAADTVVESYPSRAEAKPGVVPPLKVRGDQFV